MARKKKKSNNRNDARGYSTGTVNHRNKNKQQQQDTLEKVGKGTRTIQVTSKAYEELIILIDQLKKSLSDGEQVKCDIDSSKEMSQKKRKRPIVNVSMENKRFVKKVTFLVRTYLETSQF